MKRLVLAALITTVAVSGFAQGRIDVGNNFGASVFRAPIYGPEAGNPGLAVTGQPGSPAFPTGSTAYTGPRLQGTGFAFEFWASTSGITTDAGALSLIGSLNFGATTGTAGFVTTTTMIVNGVDAGNPTTWQIRVWDKASGPDYANALIRGSTALINSAPLGGTTTGGPVLNPSTSSGWTSFNIYAVPEPSTFVLAGLGAAALLVLRRRK